MTTFFSRDGIALKGRCTAGSFSIFADSSVDDSLLMVQYTKAGDTAARSVVDRDFDANEADGMVVSLGASPMGGDNHEAAAGTFTWTGGGRTVSGTWEALITGPAGATYTCTFAGWAIHAAS